MDNLALVIPSRRRPESALRVVDIFSALQPVVCVADSEEQDYAEAGHTNIVTHPDDVVGIGPIRQWVLDNFTHEVVVQADDDIAYVHCNVGTLARRIVDKDHIAAIICNAANCAADIGAHVFGFDMCWDVRKFKPYKPFSFNGWVGGVIGFVGRSEECRYSDNMGRADIDYCLQALLHHRVIWRDDRFAFPHTRSANVGGAAPFKTRERDLAEVEWLLAKWGRYIRARLLPGGTLSLNLMVERSLSMRGL